MKQTFVHAMMTSMGCDPAEVATQGVSVRPSPERAENHVSAGYLFDEHLIISCDPAAEALLGPAEASCEPTLAAWNDFAIAAGGELLGAARMQLLNSHVMPPIDVAPGYELRQLNRGMAADVALIQQLVDESTQDDLDEVELDIDALNEIVMVFVDQETDKIACFADTYEFDMAPAFHDVGMLTTPPHRDKNLGKALTRHICSHLLQQGIEPLYRCDEANVGSIRLSRALGFAPVTQLVAYRFPLT